LAANSAGLENESPATATAGTHKTAAPARRSRTFRIDLTPQERYDRDRVSQAVTQIVLRESPTVKRLSTRVRGHVPGRYLAPCVTGRYWRVNVPLPRVPFLTLAVDVGEPALLVLPGRDRLL
jgi:hypothetical protein